MNGAICILLGIGHPLQLKQSTDANFQAARRRIAPNDELTADYALWLYNVAWMLDPCRCGSPLCRRRITAHDWRLPEVQARYAGHFTPFLNGKIASLNSIVSSRPPDDASP